ncbi:MAG TPA: hypothetical protein VIX87_10565 [Steroidobacteraceae bacterium]
MSLEQAPCCGRCRFFSPAPQDIERQLPGLRVLSSAYGAVRAEDGLCREHDRYIAASGSCAAYRRRVAPLPA